MGLDATRMGALSYEKSLICHCNLTLLLQYEHLSKSWEIESLCHLISSHFQICRVHMQCYLFFARLVVIFSTYLALIICHAFSECANLGHS